MTDFDAAARMAASDVFNSPRLEVLSTIDANPKTIKNDIGDIITKHYAELEATYGKLVGFIDHIDKHYPIKTNWFNGGKCCEVYDELPIVIRTEFRKLLADPSIAALIAARKDEGND